MTPEERKAVRLQVIREREQLAEECRQHRRRKAWAKAEVERLTGKSTRRERMKERIKYGSLNEFI